MAINIVKTDSYETGFVHDRREEFLLDSTDDLMSLPVDAYPGSIAYTTDMANAWQMSPNGNWTKISGDWQNYLK